MTNLDGIVLPYKTAFRGVGQNAPDKIIVSKTSIGDKDSTQQQLIECAYSSGKAIVPVFVIYHLGKTAPDDYLNGLRNDFKKSLFITGTTIDYSKEGLGGKIIHNYQSDVFAQFETKLPIIPVYHEVCLEDALYQEGGLKFFQALFNTKDSADNIIKVLEKISGETAKNILLWTEDKDLRSNYSKSAVTFRYALGNLHIGCENTPDSDTGITRMIQIKK